MHGRSTLANSIPIGVAGVSVQGVDREKRGPVKPGRALDLGDGDAHHSLGPLQRPLLGYGA